MRSVKSDDEDEVSALQVLGNSARVLQAEINLIHRAHGQYCIQMRPIKGLHVAFFKLCLPEADLRHRAPRVRNWTHGVSKTIELVRNQIKAH